MTDQLAFTSLLTSGEYGRHLRHMRRRYASRRKALIGALAQYLPHATVVGVAAGIQLIVRFPSAYRVDELVDNATKLGVAVQSLAQFYAEHSAAPAGLVLGYANHNETQLVTGVRTLARALPRKGVR